MKIYRVESHVKLWYKKRGGWNTIYSFDEMYMDKNCESARQEYERQLKFIDNCAKQSDFDKVEMCNIMAKLSVPQIGSTGRILVHSNKTKLLSFYKKNITS